MPGGLVSDDAIRCLIISHHLLDANEIILIHHTRCGMLAFTDDLLKAGLEGDPAAEKLLGQAPRRASQRGAWRHGAIPTEPSSDSLSTIAALSRRRAN